MEDRYIGALQPMTGGAQQEDFGRMIDHVLLVCPEAPVPLIKRRLNHHKRQLESMRSWAGLMVRGTMYCAGMVVEGKATFTQGSHWVQGVDVTWPYADAVDTTLASPAEHPRELQEVDVADATGIREGDWLWMQDSVPGTTPSDVPPGGGGYWWMDGEFVLVHAIKDATITIRPRQQHAVGALVYRSSYCHRQMRAPDRHWLYTIIGVDPNGYIRLDSEWTYASSEEVGYQIVQAYVTLPRGLKMLWSAVNPQQGWALKTHMPVELLNRYDTWRTSQGFTFALFDATPDWIGRIRYEVYPTPLTEQSIPYVAARVYPDMRDEEDTPPPCIPSGILVDMTLSDIMMTDRTSKYYDPQAARVFMEQAKTALDAAILDDDNKYMQNLTWDYSRYRYPGMGSSFIQAHDEDGVWGYSSYYQ